MKRIATFAALLMAIILAGPANHAFADATDSIGNAGVVRHEAIVRFTPGVDVDARAAELGIEVLDHLGGADDNTVHVRVDPFAGLASQLGRLSALDDVVYAEPNTVLELAVTPDDPDYASLWGLQGGNGSNAAAAWDLGYTGSNQVYVAVVDSGIDVTHPDLAANVWVNQAELNGEAGIDDDGNGFIDDINGYDFLNDDGSVYDANEHYHGTHVAGTIGAVGNNATGVTGVNWNVKLISAKFIKSDGTGDAVDAIKALDYITMLRTKLGLDIIATNNSYGGPRYLEAFNDAVRRGGDAGILFVAAAGNDGADLETRNDFPAVYNCHTPDRAWDCVVTVAAINSSGNLASFSNFGATRVDLAAPGVDIYSTTKDAAYSVASGTSMAAPHVTGALALCVGAYRGTSAKEARALLLENVKLLPSLTGKVATGGTLDAVALVSDCAALSSSFAGAPDLARASAIYTDRIRLDWADSTSGEYEHEIQIAKGAAGCTGTFSHYAFIGPGIDSYPIRGLDEAEFYCLRVRAISGGSVSAWSTSNVSITWTSNAPFITGKVTLQDGVTPVSDALVRWQPAASSSSSSILSAYTSTDGSYVLQVSAGTNGKLSVSSDTAWTSLRPTPTIPLGLNVGGEIVVTQDTLVNLKTPPQHLVTFELRDRDTGLPIAGAKLYAERDTIYRCNDTEYKAWASASNTFCSFYPGGIKAKPPITDANGQVTLALPAAEVYTPNTYSFSLVPTANDPEAVQYSVTPSQPAEVVQVQTSELVTISGKVLQANGAGAGAGISVWWQPAAIPGNVFQRSALTADDSSYSLQVPKDQKIYLAFTAPDRCASDGCASRLLPLGFTGSGYRTFSSDTAVDLTAVATDRVTIRVVEAGTDNPVVGASLRATREAVEYCDKSGSYLPFALATADACKFYFAGSRFNPPKTDSNGEIVLSLPTSANSVKSAYNYNVHHPSISGLIVPLSFAPSSGNLKVVEFPAGTSTITGKVLTHDGRAVSGVAVTYRAVGQSNQVASLSTTTDSQGNYTLTVPSGSPGELAAANGTTHQSFEYSLGPWAEPGLPLGLRAGGVFTPNGDQTIDLKMPEMAKVTLTAVDAYSETPVAGAKLKYSRYAVNYCDQSGYKAFVTATSGICSFWPLGSNNMWPLTDANGKIDLYFPLTAAVRNVSEYAFTVTHPMSNTRVQEVRVQVASTADQALTAVIPGTPSVPEQPTVTAGNSSVTLTWTEPWNGGAYIDYYQTWYSLNAQGPFQRITTGTCAGNIPAANRSCEVTDLVPGVTYYFAIIAHNVVGASGLSVAISSIPTGEVAAVPGGGVPTDSRFAALTPTRSNSLNLARRSALVDGSGQVTAPIRIEDATRRTLGLTSGSRKVDLSAGDQMEVREDGVVAIAPDSNLSVSASGFQPGSMVSVLLVPDSYYGISASSLFAAANQVLVLGTAEVSESGEAELSSEVDVPEGGYQLQIIGVDSSGDLLTFALDAEVVGFEAAVEEPLEDPELAVWTKKLDDGKVKMYAKNVVGTGKIQFMVNGKEIAWVRAVDETDPKLRSANGFQYLVRTVELVSGQKNALEIYLDGERLRRVAYTLH